MIQTLASTNPAWTGLKNEPATPSPTRLSRDARRIVGIWNGRRAKGRELWFHLRIGAAIAAGYPWLTFMCPGCQQIGETDLRSLDRHPNATIESLILHSVVGDAGQMRRS
jgi:hypothetical protein